ncbi:hypothetical protein KY284_010914 [Solanum tuberosum]|nr:hypothetical protein KY284_010914 [Solanum tuberosum]
MTRGSGGADHFYVACHWSAMEKAIHVKLNAIQVVCSSSYFLSGYLPHKDASIPQIWPRKGPSPTNAPSRSMKTPYSEALLNSKYCIHAKGFEINTARIGDALYYGCVPVILADHYDLPCADILNWESFSVIVSSLDISKLKQILQAIEYHHYVKLQNNVMKQIASTFEAS